MKLELFNIWNNFKSFFYIFSFLPLSIFQRFCEKLFESMLSGAKIKQMKMWRKFVLQFFADCRWLKLLFDFVPSLQYQWTILFLWFKFYHQRNKKKSEPHELNISWDLNLNSTGKKFYKSLSIIWDYHKSTVVRNIRTQKLRDC